MCYFDRAADLCWGENPNVPDELATTVIPHLRWQFSQGHPILFTGAGFSLGARNIAGLTVPSVGDLKALLWSLCFPSQPSDEKTLANETLADLFEEARLRHATQLRERLREQLTVDINSVPDWYSTYFSLPWSRYYTLNLDDLAVVVSRKYALPRPIASVSATRPSGIQGVGDVSALDVVHLNGTVADLPDFVTFSDSQYAERLGRYEAWYARLVSDLMSHTCVFLGTRLNEPPLWAHLELRKHRGGRHARELRPKSYLVTPHLNRSRRSLLAEFNIEWLEMGGEEFAQRVLQPLLTEAPRGFQVLAQRAAGTKGAGALQDVSSLATNPTQSSDFLLGQEPIWADLQVGRAIERQSDDALWASVEAAFRREGVRGLLVVTGTAGSGKSTALMRVSLRLVAAGIRVGWVDRDSDITGRNLLREMKDPGAPPVLAIDDADLYGGALSSIVREIAELDSSPLVLVAMRSGKVDRHLHPAVLKDLPYQEIAMSPLEDPDIDALLTVLDRENRLGILKGLTQSQQRRAFRDKAGRQLLVAMYEATSGKRFEERATEELLELEERERNLYAFVAVATSLRFSLTREDLLVASGDQSNATLNGIRSLVDRNIVLSAGIAGGGGDGLRARHRVIADLIFNELKKRRLLDEIMEGLAYVGATKVDPRLPRSARPWRFLRALIHRDFLCQSIGADAAKNLYGTLETLLNWDFHFWLQRGSLELEFGDLRLSENFLSQARSLESDNHMIETEWGYLLFKRALEDPMATVAPKLAQEAVSILEDLIRRRGAFDAYPYHVLGSQGLSWIRRAISSPTDKDIFIRRLIAHVQDGRSKHPRADDLRQLLGDLQREHLSLSATP